MTWRLSFITRLSVIRDGADVLRDVARSDPKQGAGEEGDQADGRKRVANGCVAVVRAERVAERADEPRPEAESDQIAEEEKCRGSDRPHADLRDALIDRVRRAEIGGRAGNGERPEDERRPERRQEKKQQIGGSGQSGRERRDVDAPADIALAQSLRQKSPEQHAADAKQSAHRALIGADRGAAEMADAVKKCGCPNLEAVERHAHEAAADGDEYERALAKQKERGLRDGEEIRIGVAPFHRPAHRLFDR